MSDEDPHAHPEALVAAERWDAALDAVSAALARNPEDPQLLGLLVRTLRALGRRQDALDASQRMLTVAQDPYAFRLATLVLLDVGWVDEAIGLAARAVQLDPLNAANHLALARAWAQSPRPEAVARQLAAAREAVALSPNSADAHVQIGAALAADGDLRAARAAYLQALQIEPAHAAALNNLAVLDLWSGSAEGAARNLAAALSADPQGATARRNLDALAIRVVSRAGWWALLAPIPAILAAAAGQALAARALAALAVAGLPLAVARWWRRLTAGQRTYLHTLHRRVRRRRWVWPAGAMAVGLSGLVGAAVADAGHGPSVAAAYGVVAAVVASARGFAVSFRRGWGRDAIGRLDRLRRVLGD
ncbi:MAG: tetratricopeptide repeat protein [Candidatus Nanopelagicales bacterium]